MSGLPHVPSPYSGRLRTGDHLAISAYWFATNFMWGSLFTIMLPKELKDLAPSYRVVALGFLTGVGSLMALIVPLIVGALSDRCTSRFGRRRPFMTVGITLNAIGLIAMALSLMGAPAINGASGLDLGFWATVGRLFESGHFIALVLSYLLVQLGNNITSAAYSGIIPDLVNPDQRGEASGYMALMSQLGTLLGAVGSGVLLGGQPEVLKYALLTVILIGVGGVTLFGIKENPLPGPRQSIHWPTYIKSLWIDPRQHPNFAWVWITRALVMLGFYSVVPFVNYYLIDVINSRSVDRDAPIVMGIILIASSLSGMYGGRLSDRVGRRKVVYFANALIAIFALGFIFCRNLEQVVIVGVIFGLGYGAYVSVDWALGTDVLPTKDNAAKEMAVWHIAMTLPQALAAPFAGMIIASFGKTETVQKGEKVIQYTTNGYSAVFLLCSVCFALGAYLLKNVRGVR